MWFEVIKMPNPSGERWSNLTKDDYYKLDIPDQYDYHNAMGSHWRGKITYKKVKPTFLSQAKKLFNFHLRQAARIRYDENYNAPYSIVEDEPTMAGGRPIGARYGEWQNQIAERPKNYSKIFSIVEYLKNQDISINRESILEELPGLSSNDDNEAIEFILREAAE
jgi:hypothetical protein